MRALAVSRPCIVYACNCSGSSVPFFFSGFRFSNVSLFAHLVSELLFFLCLSRLFDVCECVFVCVCNNRHMQRRTNENRVSRTVSVSFRTFAAVALFVGGFFVCWSCSRAQIKCCKYAYVRLARSVRTHSPADIARSNGAPSVYVFDGVAFCM